MPTQISKYNTFLQLVLVGAMTVAPLLDMGDSPYLVYFQFVYLLLVLGTRLRDNAGRYVVAATTIASGASYLKKGGVKFVKQ